MRLHFELHHSRNSVERLGEELSLIEGGHGIDVELLNASWPKARWASTALGWLEAQSQLALTDENSIAVSIFSGSNRAMMCRFDAGALVWCTVTDDLEGSGILYHCVNAMVRDGIKMESADIRVTLAGVESMTLELKQHFKRFFKQVEVEQTPWKWSDSQPEYAGDWDALFFANY